MVFTSVYSIISHVGSVRMDVCVCCMLVVYRFCAHIMDCSASGPNGNGTRTCVSYMCSICLLCSVKKCTLERTLTQHIEIDSIPFCSSTNRICMVCYIGSNKTLCLHNKHRTSRGGGSSSFASYYCARNPLRTEKPTHPPRSEKGHDTCDASSNGLKLPFPTHTHTHTHI